MHRTLHRTAAPTGRSAGLRQAGVERRLTSPRALFGPKKVEEKVEDKSETLTTAITSGVQLVGGIVTAVAAVSLLISTPLIQRLGALQLQVLELKTELKQGTTELKTLLQPIPLRVVELGATVNVLNDDVRIVKVNLLKR
ncbi:hypothetical protein TSOC_008280 [Tetrabaena socialis]|uniref:Uncharacterized protein n=1 Tax=Tetrabaena socialis TaxID=47790 RepID=A0A2J7ZYW4_9CHLO|nr:hypothetical protein TSOC_008280 [Tetrabaena socialis]|eukprot:PNH05457.1 hypothetical protein TSOC_008280 [Tetrabaena socialis]